jgi:hypothetical protein
MVRVVDTNEEQLKLWVEGESVHCRKKINIEVEGKVVRTEELIECCPDFSCCKPKLLATREVRESFLKGNEELRSAMCLTFLGSMLDTLPECSVHITDGDYGGV